MRSLIPSIFSKDDMRTALQSRLDTMFDDLSNDWWTNWPEARLAQARNFPAIDVKENDESFEIKAELPDMDEKDIQVSVVGNYLNIKGEKNLEQEKDDKGYHLKERSFGAFHRRIALGFAPDIDDIHAKYVKGVLAIQIPKPAEVRNAAQQIKVDYQD